MTRLNITVEVFTNAGGVEAPVVSFRLPQRCGFDLDAIVRTLLASSPDVVAVRTVDHSALPPETAWHGPSAPRSLTC